MQQKRLKLSPLHSGLHLFISSENLLALSDAKMSNESMIFFALNYKNSFAVNST
jgi:hypothetical protein